MSYLIHYNHNHDKLGRFAKSSSMRNNAWKDLHNEQDYTIKKGTVVNRVSTSNNEKDEGITYGTHTKIDKNLYISVAKDWLSANHQIEMKTIRDVKVAGVQAQAKAFVEVYQNSSIDELVEYSTPTIINAQGKQTRNNKQTQKETRAIYKNAGKNQESFDKALFKFNQGVTNNRVQNSNVTQKYIDNISKQGYDAMTDLNDLNFSQKPVIFIDRNKTLQTTKISELTDRDVDRANEYLKKKGLWY